MRLSSDVSLFTVISSSLRLKLYTQADSAFASLIAWCSTNPFNLAYLLWIIYLMNESECLARSLMHQSMMWCEKFFHFLSLSLTLSKHPTENSSKKFLRFRNFHHSKSMNSFVGFARKIIEHDENKIRKKTPKLLAMGNIFTGVFKDNFLHDVAFVSGEMRLLQKLFHRRDGARRCCKLRSKLFWDRLFELSFVFCESHQRLIGRWYRMMWLETWHRNLHKRNESLGDKAEKFMIFRVKASEKRTAEWVLGVFGDRVTMFYDGFDDTCWCKHFLKLM